jgi:hypothetical protein
MDAFYKEILNPAGEKENAHEAVEASTRGKGRDKPVIGLLNNGKPNVSFFLEAIEKELLRRGDYEIMNICKPRSAAACPDINAIAERCGFLINAVAD